MQSCRSPLGSSRPESKRPRVNPPPPVPQDGRLEAAVDAQWCCSRDVPGWEKRALQTTIT